MARSSGQRRVSGNSGRKNRVTSAPRFVFEPGEKVLNMKAVTAAVKLSATTGQATVKLPSLPAGPDHLRALGWRVTSSFLGEGQFLDGVSPVKVKSLTVAEDVDPENDDDEGPTPPTMCAVGPPGTTVLVVAKVAFIYKEH